MPLGFGNDGYVWRSDQNTAVKAFDRERTYQSERDSYRRLLEAGVEETCGLTVPRLLEYDDELWIVEMEVVSPPYILDFGKVWLDRKPDYPDDAVDYAEQKGLDDFGERWTDVKSILRVLVQYGIYYVDPNPGNINFGDPQS